MSPAPTRLARTCAVYAACHFVVDLACIWTLMNQVVPDLSACSPSAAALSVMAYDALAFCLQLPTGAALDVLGVRCWRPAALASLGLVAAGVTFGCAGAGPLAFLSVGLVACGNALFHCAGGIEVLWEEGERMAAAGEFIATGAAGFFLGSLHLGATFMPALLLALLSGCAALVHLVLSAPARSVPEASVSLTVEAGVALALIAVCVGLRSYAGMVMGFPWKQDLALAVLAVVAGKAAGGRLSDLIGAPATTAVSLGGAAVLFLLSWTSVVAGVVATFLFNYTMAITLCSLARLLPHAKGTAFGIASFALAIGALPALLGHATGTPHVLCAVSLVSCTLLEVALALLARLDRRRGGERQVSLRFGRS